MTTPITFDITTNTTVSPAAPHRGFNFGMQLSMAVSLVGVLLLLGHLADQLREGYGSLWSLVVGVACVICGLILALLFEILVRVHRIEQRISGSDRLEEAIGKGHAEPTTPPSENEARQ